MYFTKMGALILVSDAGVLGGCAAENRGTDFDKLLTLEPCARTRSLTGHRTPIKPIKPDCVCLIGARRRSAPRLAGARNGHDD
jgi:hypothetical protein